MRVLQDVRPLGTTRRPIPTASKAGLGVIAIGMLVARRAGLRSHIAFGPAMIAGAVVALGLEYQLLPA